MKKISILIAALVISACSSMPEQRSMVQVGPLNQVGIAYGQKDGMYVYVAKNISKENCVVYFLLRDGTKTAHRLGVAETKFFSTQNIQEQPINADAVCQKA